ncbi:hypothetical protein EVAR_35435_1 [Eumeta japonica]|uniref:Uncharacterized protein n=1 Tax=Eumeta variegata TaxID=151549 RepID=A0A4C1X6R2_EUMVA|nr:hypothetical protein EVAR_35435_1 [Eumeta japonica]
MGGAKKCSLKIIKSDNELVKFSKKHNTKKGQYFDGDRCRREKRSKDLTKWSCKGGPWKCALTAELRPPLSRNCRMNTRYIKGRKSENPFRTKWCRRRVTDGATRRTYVSKLGSLPWAVDSPLAVNILAAGSCGRPRLLTKRYGRTSPYFA